MKWVYDIETYPNCFTLCIVRDDGKHLKVFEVSDRKNEIEGVFKCLDYLSSSGDDMVGFNNLNFDYPVLHKVIETKAALLKSNGLNIAKKIYKYAQDQIESMKGEFANTVKEEDRHIKQIDLFKIWHFDNKAKSTSLKMLEFNMKADNIEDLPFPVGENLSSEDIDVLIKYNKHDVLMTLAFYNHSKEQVLFREQLTEKYSRNFMNHNDTKIGKDYFIMRLEDAGIKLYKQEPTKFGSKRVIIQSKRPIIYLKDCLFKYYDFKRPEFKAVLNWFAKQHITETKGVFSDIEEHQLGEVAKYAVMVEKRTKFKGKPSEKDLAEFKKEHPLGWVEEETLKATEWLFDENGEHVTEQPVDEFGNPDYKKKPKKVRVNKKSYWAVWRVAETLNVVVDGFRFDFGTGGIHGSIESKIAKENTTYDIIDADV